MAEDKYRKHYKNEESGKDLPYLHDDIMDEMDFDNEKLYDLPPRNILETDSAKYTAEYIKEVVKDLYSTDTQAYVDSKGEAVYRLTRDTKEEFIDSESRNAVRPRRSDNVRDMSNSQRVDSTYDGAAGGRREAQAPQGDIEHGVNLDYKRERYSKPLNARAARPKDDFDKPPVSSRGISDTVRKTDSTPRMERKFEGKNSKDEDFVYLRDIMEYDEDGNPLEELPLTHTEPRRYEHEGKPYAKKPPNMNKSVESSHKKPAAEYRNVTAERYESSGAQSARTHAAPDTQPPRAVRSTRTPETHGRDFYAKVPASTDKGRGLNIFAILFMAVCVITIGILVFRINTLLKETAGVDTEETQQLQASVTQLTQENSRLRDELTELNGEVERLSRDNEALGTTTDEDSEAPQEGSDDSSALQHADIVDGYYTVKSGDSLYKIADRYMNNGNLYPQIATANNMNPDSPLVSGQKLKIPGY